MNKLLLAGVAALFLATGAAHAGYFPLTGYKLAMIRYLTLALALLAAMPTWAAEVVPYDSTWEGGEQTRPYKCDGDDDGLDSMSVLHTKAASDSPTYVIVIDSVRSWRRKGKPLPVIRFNAKTKTLDYIGKRCRPYIGPGEGE